MKGAAADSALRMFYVLPLSVHLPVCLSDCPQDKPNNVRRILIRVLEGGMCDSNSRLNFDLDLAHDVDTVSNGILTIAE